MENRKVLRGKIASKASTSSEKHYDSPAPAPEPKSCCVGLNEAIGYYFLNVPSVVDPYATGAYTQEEFAPRGQAFAAVSVTINKAFRDAIATIRDKCIDPECCGAMALAAAESAIGTSINAYNAVLSGSFPTAALPTIFKTITDGLDLTLTLILTTSNKPNCYSPCGSGCGNGCTKYVIRA
ncbi:MAG: hypothetical protein M1486_07005 [Gammaproteobacteria bacterium]|nr:hypothetical protein [Gammaproteobacteria bacterium]